MNTRDALHASLAVTPPLPTEEEEERARKMHAIVVWVQMEDALDRARRFARRRNGVVLHHWLNRAAELFLELGVDDVTSLRDLDNFTEEALLDAVVRRVREGNENAREVIDKAARKVAKVPKKKKGRAR